MFESEVLGYNDGILIIVNNSGIMNALKRRFGSKIQCVKQDLRKFLSPWQSLFLWQQALTCSILLIDFL